MTTSPLLTVPGSDVKLLPLTEYSPPEIEIGTGTSIPATVTALEVATVFNAASVIGVKVNKSGIAWAASVDTLNVPLTVPIVSVAFLYVENVLADVSLTAMVSPFFTVAGPAVKVPPFIEYSPPSIDMIAVESIPLTVKVLDV